MLGGTCTLLDQCNYYGLGKRFEWKKLTKYLLKLFVLVKIIKSNILNVKGLANEDEKTSVQIDFLKNNKICLSSNLFRLKSFS